MKNVLDSLFFILKILLFNSYPNKQNDYEDFSFCV